MDSIKSSISGVFTKNDTYQSIIKHVASKTNQSQTYVTRILEACLRSDAAFALVPKYYQVTSTDKDSQRRVTQYYLPSLLFDSNASWAEGRVVLKAGGHPKPHAHLMTRVWAHDFKLDGRLRKESLDTPAGRAFVALSISTIHRVSAESDASSQVKLMLHRTMKGQLLQKRSGGEQAFDNVIVGLITELDSVGKGLSPLGAERVILSEAHLAAPEHWFWTTPGALPEWLVCDAAPVTEEELPEGWKPTLPVVTSKEPVAKWIRPYHPDPDSRTTLSANQSVGLLTLYVRDQELQ